MKKYLSCYHPVFITSLVYMLQATEYDLGDYLAWFWRARDLRRVARRGHLVLTAKAKLLLLIAAAMVLLEAAVIAVCIILYRGHPAWLLAAGAVLLVAPLLTVYGLALPLWLGELLIQRPRQRAIIAAAKAKLRRHPGLRLAIAGSYGKTTFKETLATILSGHQSVAATPGNMNTPLGISRFINRLQGDEAVLIFELGEYYPGDIKELCELVQPQMGVITGVNEAHLSKFKTLDRTVATIFELADALPGGPVYKNAESRLVAKRAAGDPLLYNREGVNGWRVTHAKAGLHGTTFTASKGRLTVHADTALLGLHQIGPLVACIDIAARLGLSVAQIEEGISRTRPFEHRLEPRHLAGAWVIDDTYNGNSDGIRAGLDWLAVVPARRRVYVTPGLVEQGSQTGPVHEQIGRWIAPVADVVVLMRNSTTPFIEAGLAAAGFKGQVHVVTDPVAFYGNLDQFVATGDVVLMQNDWTDNFA